MRGYLCLAWPARDGTRIWGFGDEAVSVKQDEGLAAKHQLLFFYIRSTALHHVSLLIVGWPEKGSLNLRTTR